MRWGWRSARAAMPDWCARVRAQAVVSASFDVPHGTGPLASLLAQNGLDVEPGEPLLIRRIVKADGGSRAFVNDQPASAGLLREIAGASGRDPWPA